MVILEHSVMIDNELTRNAARIACLPSHQHFSSTSYLQKEGLDQNITQDGPAAF